MSASSALATASSASSTPSSSSSAMDPRAQKAVSHALSKILRHAAPSMGLALDSSGYARVDDLLSLPAMRRLQPIVTLQTLQHVARVCPKQRFGLQRDSETHEWLIRANQGHNAALASKIDTDSLLQPITLDDPLAPLPTHCVHGTTLGGWSAIAASGGLHPMGRTHVHFSARDFGAADTLSGMRNSSQVLIHVDVERCLRWAASAPVRARALQLSFYRSANDVILTAGVQGLGGFLPSFLFDRVEEVVGSGGPAARKQRRPMPGWVRPTEEQWNAQHEGRLAPPAAAAAAVTPAGRRAVASATPSSAPELSARGKAAAAAAAAAAAPATSQWGPLPTSRPPPGWTVPPHLAHFAQEALAGKLSSPAAAATAVATSSSSATSSDAAKQPFAYLAVLDFEATCDEQSQGGPRFAPQEVLEFPIVLLDTASGEVKSVFHRYVTPQIHPQLTPFCTQLTGITQAMVSPESGALPFPTVWAQANAWLAEQGLLPPPGVDDSDNSPKFAFVTCGDWDLRQMLPTQLAQLGVSKRAIDAHWASWINVKGVFNSFYQPKVPVRGMTDMLQKLRIPLQGRHHSGIDDSKNIAAICARMLLDGCVFRYTYQRKQKAMTAAAAAPSSVAAAAPAASNAAEPAAHAPASASVSRGPSALQAALGRSQQSRIQ